MGAKIDPTIDANQWSCLALAGWNMSMDAYRLGQLTDAGLGLRARPRPFETDVRTIVGITNMLDQSDKGSDEFAGAGLHQDRADGD
jgi:hypothetical protein